MRCRRSWTRCSAMGPHDNACGVFAVWGLAHWAPRHGLDVRLRHLAPLLMLAESQSGRRVLGYSRFAIRASTGVLSLG